MLIAHEGGQLGGGKTTTALGAQVRIGPMRQQDSCHLVVAVEGDPMQGSKPAHVGRADARARTEKQSDGRQMPTPHGLVKRRFAESITFMKIGAPVDAMLHDLVKAPGSRPLEGGVSVWKPRTLAQFDVDEELDHGLVTRPYRTSHRGQAVLVGRM